MEPSTASADITQHTHMLCQGASNPGQPASLPAVPPTSPCGCRRCCRCSAHCRTCRRYWCRCTPCEPRKLAGGSGRHPQTGTRHTVTVTPPMQPSLLHTQLKGNLEQLEQLGTPVVGSGSLCFVGSALRRCWYESICTGPAQAAGAAASDMTHKCGGAQVPWGKQHGARNC